MQSASPHPSILLLSSVAAVIPAPSRALYAATKSASLLLFQALSIEHPHIHFSNVLPGTIEGNFQSNAIDLPTVAAILDPETTILQKTSNSPLSKKLPRVEVARRCVEAVDHGDRTVWMPSWYQYAHALYWVLPSIIERGAKNKYHIS